MHGRVLRCTACESSHRTGVLRDRAENIPQPGYVGKSYTHSGVAFVGQNPAICPDRLSNEAQPYMGALKMLHDNPSLQSLDRFRKAMEDFSPSWTLFQRYLPLSDCGLQLDQIAYFNVVRCRTFRNTPPRISPTRTCTERHLRDWLKCLRPKCVIFLGKWGYDAAGHVPQELGICTDFLDRSRSLSREVRAKNRQRIIELVKRVVAQPDASALAV
jgi:uracil-DNA glycosylase